MRAPAGGRLPGCRGGRLCRGARLPRQGTPPGPRHPRSSDACHGRVRSSSLTCGATLAADTPVLVVSAVAQSGNPGGSGRSRGLPVETLRDRSPDWLCPAFREETDRLSRISAGKGVPSGHYRVARRHDRYFRHTLRLRDRGSYARPGAKSFDLLRADSGESPYGCHVLSLSPSRRAGRRGDRLPATASWPSLPDGTHPPQRRAPPQPFPDLADHPLSIRERLLDRFRGDFALL